MERRLVGVAGLVVAAVAAAATGPASSSVSGPSARVVVQAASAAQAARAVHAAGGHVTRSLALVDGVAATVPAGSLTRLSATRGVVAVTPDERVTPSATDTTTGPTGAPVVYRDEVGATGLSQATNAPSTVAIIDTGVSDVGGLGAHLVRVPDPNTPGATAVCANFSHESSCDDSYGHGTFLAGLVAGGGAYPGVDPSARLVSVKIAGRDGASDVSQLLAAIQWVVSYKDQLGIQVLNLSLGTDSTHDYRRDPVNRAVERAWRAGIVVVVAASNRGPGATTISKPADDPLVVTVGAVDDRGTKTRSDDTVPAFSGRGPAVNHTDGADLVVPKPDVTAPGVGLVSLSVPGSHIETTAGPSGFGAAGYRRGSGTSQATAVVSGAVALLLERENLTPDEVKAALRLGAAAIDAPATQVGAGLVNVPGALGAKAYGATQPDPVQLPLDGLDASRGHVLVSGLMCGAVDVRRRTSAAAGCDQVQGQLVARSSSGLFGDVLNSFDPVAYAGNSWYGNSWYSSQWQGNSWYGNSWYGNSWYGNSWYGYDGSTSTEGEQTPQGTVLPGSAWFGVWK